MSSEFIILCAYTARTQAYLQALQHRKLNPSLVVFYGSPLKLKLKSDRSFISGDINGIFYPDLTELPIDTVVRNSWHYQSIESEKINSPEMLELLSNLSPELTIYSGYSGQLVPEELLQKAGSVLHIHTGWLPQYRGSTTIYYSLLNEGRCTASALLLDVTIDTGPVLARNHYPKPAPGIDIDYLYDNTIRADLLCAIIENYIEKDELPIAIEQNSNDLPFYIIHPVLKHLAVLCVDNENSD